MTQDHWVCSTAKIQDRIGYQARIALARHLARSMRGDLELARTPVPEVTVWVPPSVSQGGA